MRFEDFQESPGDQSQESLGEIETESYVSFDDYEREASLLNKIDAILDNPGSASRQAGESETNKFIQELKQIPEYVRYKQYNVSFEDLNEMVHELKEALQNATDIDEYGEKARKFLTETLNDLGDQAEQYRKSVIRGEHLRRSSSRFRMEPELYKEKILRYDQDRRVHHNRIMDDLHILLRFPKIVNEKLGTDISWPKFFKPKEIENRKLVGQWAFDSAVVQRINALAHDIEKELEG